MAAKKLFFHIGFHKTGSTFLQKKIFPGLTDVNLIVERDLPSTFLKIFHQDPLSRNNKALAESLKEKFDSKKNNLVSEEKLSGQPFYKYVNNKNITDFLFESFPDAHILIFIRNQADMLLSLYKQYIKEGGYLSLSDFMNQRKESITSDYHPFQISGNLEMFEYSHLVSYYIKLFGKEKVHVFQYEQFKEDKTSFYKKLERTLGLDVAISEKQQSAINVGYNYRQIKIARFLNRFFWSQINRSAIIPRVKLPLIGTLDKAKIRKVLTGKVFSSLLKSKRKLAFSDTVLATVKAHYRVDNERLEKITDQKLHDSYF